MKEIKEYYNARYSQLGNRAFRPIEAYKVFLDYLLVREGDKLLDVGCGNGFLLKLASEREAETYGVDISSVAVELAQKNSPRSDIRIGDAMHLAYPSDCFDYLTCLGVLEHCPDMEAVLAGFHRVIKPTGGLCIMVPNKYYFMWLRGKGTEQQKIGERLLSLWEWRRLFNRCGFGELLVLKDNYAGLLLRKLIPLFFTYQFIFLLGKG